MPATIADQHVLNAKLRLTRVGAWHANVESSGAAALEGAVTLTVEGQAFVGTVLPDRSGVSGGRVRTKLVGGAGGLSKKLDAKNYASGVGAGATVRTVVEDLLRECGETLSSTAEDAVLGVSLPKWERSEGPASRALVDVLETVSGASWRVLADGTVWVGVDTFPDQAIEHVLIDEDWATGVLELAPARPDLRPGVTFLGHRISYVCHYVAGGSLRTEAYVVDSPANAFDRIFGGLRREIDFSRAFSARVVEQNSDGTVELDPDDPKMKGRGLGRVPIRCGIPAEVEVSKGARCLFAFANGDPSRPYVLSWESTAVDKVRVNGGSLPAARQGDLCQGELTVLNLSQIAAALLCAAPGSPPTLNPALAPLVGVPGAGVPDPVGPISVYSQVSTGNPTIEE